MKSAYSQFPSCFLSTVFLLCWATGAMSQDAAIEKRTKVVFVEGNYGFSTYKSETLTSNDTGSTLHANVGAHVGEGKEIVLQLEYDSATVALELIDHALSKKDTDILINYRWSYLSFGALIAANQMGITSAGTDVLLATSSGFGGNVALAIPVGRSSYTYLKTKFATYNESTDTISETNKLSSQMVVDVGGNLLLSRDLLFMTFGYRYNTLALTVNDTDGAELMTTTYLGIGMGIDF